MAASKVRVFTGVSTISTDRDRRTTRRSGTSAEDLRDIVKDHWSRPRNPFDEVYPGIFIGDARENWQISANDRLQVIRHSGDVIVAAWSKVAVESENTAGLSETHWRRRTAKDITVLKMKRISNVVNAAFGRDPDVCVDTNEDFYTSRGHPCQFLGIPAMDLECFKLHYFFKGAVDFIDEALESNGKVLVHCREGISRSATLVIAYLMMKKKMTAMEAVRHVRSKRQIYPNSGFLEQLCDLDQRLKSQRGY